MKRFLRPGMGLLMLSVGIAGCTTSPFSPPAKQARPVARAPVLDRSARPSSTYPTPSARYARPSPVEVESLPREDALTPLEYAPTSPGAAYPTERYSAGRYPEERYPTAPTERYSTDRYPEERYPTAPTERYRAERYPPAPTERYPAPRDSYSNAPAPTERYPTPRDSYSSSTPTPNSSNYRSPQAPEGSYRSSGVAYPQSTDPAASTRRLPPESRPVVPKAPRPSRPEFEEENVALAAPAETRPDPPPRPAPKPAVPAPVPRPADLPPAEITRDGNQAVVALLDSADKYVKGGQLDKAGAALERALRIEPRNAGIWHDLAQIRLHQGQYQQAESLASKSNNLAASNRALQSRNWKLISVARKAGGNAGGAEEAEAQATTLAR